MLGWLLFEMAGPPVFKRSSRTPPSSTWGPRTAENLVGSANEIAFLANVDGNFNSFFGVGLDLKKDCNQTNRIRFSDQFI